MNKVCPKCGVPMIEEITPVSISWWCVVCGYTEILPKNHEAQIF